MWYYLLERRGDSSDRITSSSPPKPGRPEESGSGNELQIYTKTIKGNEGFWWMIRGEIHISPYVM